eukprot:7938465-Pyramimonas_sp.AAC.1
MRQGGSQNPVPCNFHCGRDSCSKDCVDESKSVLWGKGEADMLQLPNGNTAVYGSDSDWHCERTYIQIYRDQHPDRRKFQAVLGGQGSLSAVHQGPLRVH